ncbi:hypothetical protein MMC15_002029 [Xylographa vitiligo]|nr:hypothetical protein [Xylographa vitiligo]
MADPKSDADPVKAIDVSHIESVGSDEKLQGSRLTEYAKTGADIEHHMPPWEAVKTYPMAIFWAVLVSMCVVMEGYDTILIGNFFAYPTFAQKYGTLVPGSGYQLTAPWQAGVSDASGVGAFFGALANGYLVTWLGHKRVLLGSLLVLSCFIFMTFFAPDIGVLTAGEFLCGLPWGIFATVAPAYASEVLPLSLRVYLTSYTNMCFIIGQLIAAGVLDGLLKLTNEWSYRVPFALQWFWPAFLFPVLLFMPESPWHLVRKGRLEDAEKSLMRLQRQSADIDPKATLATIVHTNNLEQELSTGTSYWDCFRGTERRRTEIACVCFAGQVLAGLNFAYNSTYFFQQVGLNTSETYNLNVGGTAMALFGTIVSWFCIMPYVGRRTIYIWGMSTMALILYVIGFLNIDTGNQSVATAQAVLTLIWTFVFQLSIGQLVSLLPITPIHTHSPSASLTPPKQGWALPAEMGSTRLRQKTVCLARNSYYIASTIGQVLEPYFLNPTEWNLRGYTGFFWAGTATVVAFWAYFRLPETKGRSFDDIDLLFAKKVPARKFRGYDVDTFDERETARLRTNPSVV